MLYYTCGYFKNKYANSVFCKGYSSVVFPMHLEFYKVILQLECVT